MPKKRENPSQWMPIPSKPDEECTLLEIWSRYRVRIAKFRGFRNEEDTISAYTATLKVIEAALNKPAAIMTAYDCVEAVSSVLYRTTGIHAGEPYAASTLQTRMTVLKDIYKFLESMAICMDPLWMSPWEMINSGGVDLTQIDAVKKNTLKEGARLKLRALTVEQEKKLVRLIRENFEGPEEELDGRWFGIALYLYLGLRPSEGRGLRYCNCCAFRDVAERKYCDIAHSADKEGEIKEGTKSKNGIRRIPIHIELEKLMQQWTDIVRKLTGEQKLDAYPMICCGKDFSMPCSATKMAVFAKKVLQKVVSKEDLQVMGEAMYIETILRGEDKKTRKVEESSDYSLTTYVFRRNFASKLYAETTLSDRDIRLCMGHDREYDDTTIADYAEDKVLVRMRAMDKRMIDASLRTDWLAQIGLNSGMECTGCGEYFFCVSREDAKHGMDIRILVENMEPGTDLVVELQRKLPPGATIEVESWTVPVTDTRPHRLDSTLAHWQLGWPTKEG